MTAQQLRNSILQQAIQGRLVPQDPNDEPASVLLERTTKVKEQLVKEGKLRKKDLEILKVSEDEKQFDLPKGWEWVNIDQIATVKGGKRLPVGEKISDIPTPYIYIRVTEMKNNTLQDNDLRYISAELHELLKNYIIHSTDLYLTIAGTIGAVGDVPEKFDGMNLTENALKLTNFQVDKKFLIYCLSSDFVQSQFKDKTNKVGQPKLAMERVKSTVIPLPPLAEQRRIVAKIEELMPLVEKYGKAQTELDNLNQDLPRRLRQSVLQQAIQGKLVEQDPNDEPASVLLGKNALPVKLKNNKGKDFSQDLFDIPDSWTWAPFKQCAEVLYGFPFNSQLFIDSPQGMPLIRIRDVKPAYTRTYTTEIAEDRYIISKGDMLVGMDGNFNVNFWNSDDAYLNQRVCKIIANEKVVLQKYLYYYLPIVFDEISSNVSYCTVKHIADTHFNLILIPLPPLAEQRRIVAKIEELFANIDKLK